MNACGLLTSCLDFISDFVNDLGDKGSWDYRRVERFLGEEKVLVALDRRLFGF